MKTYNEYEEHRISTHASAREATLNRLERKEEPMHFNSRLRTGGDGFTGRKDTGKLNHFNSRLRTGGDTSHAVP